MTSDLEKKLQDLAQEYIGDVMCDSWTKKILDLFKTELAQAVKEEKEKAKSWLLYCPNCKQTLEGIEIRQPEEKK